MIRSVKNAILNISTAQLEKFLQLTYVVLLPFYILSFPNKVPDTQIYIDAGANVFSGLSPYQTDIRVGSGPIASAVIYLISSLIPGDYLSVALRLFSILGFLFLYCLLAVGGSKLRILAFMPILYLSGPVREVLVNIQVTGIFALFVSLAIFVWRKIDFISNAYGTYVFIFLLVVSFELKPNLGLPIILFFLSKMNSGQMTRFVVSFCAVEIFAALFYVLVMKENLTSEWISRLLNFSSVDPAGNDALSIWVWVPQQAAQVISYVVFLLLLLLIILAKGNGLHWALLSPLSLVYVHLLDFSLSIVNFVASIMRKKLDFIEILLLQFLILPWNVNSLTGLTALFALNAFLLASKSYTNFSSFSLALLAYSITQYICHEFLATRVSLSRVSLIEIFLLLLIWGLRNVRSQEIRKY
jgi:hypothetical protein